ncbi:MAG: thioredoxin family protein [Oenococcus sp.]|uniref:thioredoxin family protein n=1 Tax=Oenococcus sp. TaxID=1979414 RepID=UPI0039E76F2F
MNPKHIYDTIIIGAGPAGLTAGIYAGRAALDTMIIERDQVGGQVTTTSTVWNYPAVADIDGSKLVNLMQKQIDEFRVPIVQDDIQSMDLNQEVKVLYGQQDYFARSVIFAAGDLLAKPLRQIVTAAADGALAATSAENYVIEQKRQLGVPIKAAKKQRPVSSITQQTTLDSEEEKTPLAPAHAGTWFPDEIKAQLKALFVRLNQAVTLLVLTDDSAKSRQLLSFTKELSALDPAHLSVQQETSTATADKRLPALILLDNKKQDSGIRFSGIPTGHELNSIVLAIYNLAGPGQSIDTKLVDQIKALPAMHLQIGVSLTCHFCPDVVAASQRIAALNPKITAEMIDLQLFPDFRKSKKIMSVPAFMINEGDVTFGSQTLNQIIDLCQQQA